ncbi:uncharacterized protein E0L32_004482 [Thyridium curvatum]|uniref:Uncharacterized protein n=1 Tax=Thyridium curvatum TaxID=1093900 RepID=A0A507AZT1_9PEZI|nr:uncharacterized protein E0L32_004482 [Thyridium curvatum]TPX15502.1 hypothetical protein E0L32_004482 [Thyridium curvatum]
MESHHKITKPRSKMVKPILKKLSHSEKNSLDLDRGWDEQAGGYGWAGGGGGGGGLYESAGAGRSAKDVSFIFGEPSAPMVSSSATGSGAASAAARPRFQHGRSPSGTSHVSVATNGSGGPPRAGSFVHPFQQTPRTSTPPLMSYANSMASFDCGPRDYSPTITEDDDGTVGCGGGGDEDDVSVPPSLSTQVHHHHHHHHRTHSSSLSQSNLRRPSLASQRTSSFSDVSGAKPLRINTKPATARRGPGKLSSSLSHSDLHLNLTLDSPISSTLNANSAFPPSTSSQAPSIISPISLSASVAPMSPLRSSLDGFRLRSRSEVDTWDRAETIREARRRFEERERAKDEKREREASKKQERREQREAKVLEKAHAAQLRKNSRSSTDVPGLAGLAPRRPGPAAVATGSSKSSSRRGSSAAAAKKLSSDLAASSTDEKRGAEFLSSNYDSVEGGRTPRLGGGVDDVRFQPAGPRRGAAKRRTQGYWTGFILWLRTRLFRLGKA